MIHRTEVTSPLCHCGKEEQTAHHILLQCDSVDLELRSQADHYLRPSGGEMNSIALLNASREVKFMECVVRIMEIQKHFLRDSIELN